MTAAADTLNVAIATSGNTSIDVLANDSGAGLQVTSVTRVTTGSSSGQVDPPGAQGLFGKLEIAPTGNAVFSYYTTFMNGSDRPSTPLGHGQSISEFFSYNIRGDNGATAAGTIAVKLSRTAIARLEGSDGADTIAATARDTVINGGPGNDNITGSYGYDTLVGGPGDDMLSGGPRTDLRMNIRTGVDHYVGGGGNDTIRAGDSWGDTAIFAGPYTGYSLAFGAGGSVTVTDTNPADGDEGTDTLTGVELLQFSDMLRTTHVFAVNFTSVYMTSEGFPDAMVAPGDALSLSVGYIPFVGIREGVVLKLMAADGGPAPAWLQFDPATYRLTGTAPATDAMLDLVIEGAGTSGFREYDSFRVMVAAPRGGDVNGTNADERFTGTAGDDRVFTGGGRDVVLGSPGADLIVKSRPATLFRDTLTVDYRASPGAVNIDLGLGLASGGDATGDILVGGVDVLIGSLFDDVLIAGEPDVRIEGAEGNDVLVGTKPRFYTFVGGPGADTLVAVHFAIVTADYRDSPAAIAIDLNAMTSHGGHAEGDTLLRVRSIYGSAFDDVVVGDAVLESVYGGDGNDRLMSGAAFYGRLYGENGDDTLTGGTQEDTLVGGLGNDHLDGGAGTDTASYSDSHLRSVSSGRIDLVSGTARFGSEVDTMQNVENVEGSSIDEVIIGSSGHNRLNGGLGNDVIYGGHGSDLIEGSGGSDLLIDGTSGGRLFGWGMTAGGVDGDDILVGLLGGGTRTLSMNGGDGGDTFVLAVTTRTSAVRIEADIADFAQGSDRIDLSDLRDAQGNLLDLQDVLSAASVRDGATFINLDPFVTAADGSDVAGSLKLAGFTGTLTAADFHFQDGVNWEALLPADVPPVG